MNLRASANAGRRLFPPPPTSRRATPPPPRSISRPSASTASARSTIRFLKPPTRWSGRSLARSTRWNCARRSASAARLQHAPPFGLTASGFTRSEASFRAVGEQLKVGNLCANLPTTPACAIRLLKVVGLHLQIHPGMNNLSKLHRYGRQGLPSLPLPRSSSSAFSQSLKAQTVLC